MENENYEKERKGMVESQLIGRGISDSLVLKAMETVPRHLFVPEELQSMAYKDMPLPIGYGQTISQPYIVGLMCEIVLISPDDKVLEIGAGSGYQAAILSFLAEEVYGIEIVKPLAEIAKERLKKLGYTNIHIKEGDGYLGWEEYAPYDVILIAAAARDIPSPLIEQLKVGGRLIMPLEEGMEQKLIQIQKTDAGLIKKELLPVRFVPFTRNES